MKERLRQELQRKKNFAKKLRKSTYLKKKYGLEDLPSTSKKFIVIQIDGLPYYLLKRLTETKRYMPFMHKLLKSYNVTQFEPGYPSTTPYVQAGIMYGANDNIPGFRFYDKENNKEFSLGLVGSAQTIEAELEKNNFGILSGGTSIGNIYCGGADRTVMTVAHMYKKDGTPKSVKDILLLILLHPTASSKVILFSLYEFMLELFESFIEVVHALFTWRDSNFPLFFPYIPFYRMFMNGVVREVATEASIIEMDRHVPAIYTTYSGFDLVAHYRGPESWSSYGVLRQIDFSVRKVVRKAKKQGYDIYVLSDHGQVPSIPFDKKYYETFEDFIERISKLSTRSKVEDYERSSKVKYIYYKMNYYYKHFSLPLRTISWGIMQLLRAAFRRQEKKHHTHVKKGKDLAVHISSCLALLYFTKHKKRLDISEIQKKYPYVISEIVSHPGVGFVIGMEGKNVEVISTKGKVIIKPRSVEYIGEKFLHVYGDEKKLLKQIKSFALQKYNGDLIINGAYDGEKIIAFEPFHFGAHDSIGGAQNQAFFVSKEKVNLSEVLSSKELYDIFLRYHDR